MEPPPPARAQASSWKAQVHRNNRAKRIKTPFVQVFNYHRFPPRQVSVIVKSSITSRQLYRFQSTANHDNSPASLREPDSHHDWTPDLTSSTAARLLFLRLDPHLFQLPAAEGTPQPAALLVIGDGLVRLLQVVAGRYCPGRNRTWPDPGCRRMAVVKSATAFWYSPWQNQTMPRLL